MASRSPANSAGSSRIVAVDLGPRFVRVVEVEQAGDETKIIRRGSAALPLNCWIDVAANRDAMAASIREALSSAGITAKSVVACLPRRLVTVRFARLPQAPPEQVRGMIEFEAQQYILFPLNEVILDYYVPVGIGSGLVTAQDDMQMVLLAAARKSLVAEIVSVFDRVGVELSRLSVSALALAEHVRDSLEPTAVISLESGAMDVSVVADGQLLFTRSSALEVAGIARDAAANRFSEEVARSFTAYQNEFRQKPLAHVYLCGSETATTHGDWMDHALEEALEKPVVRLHSRLLPSADADARSYAIAAGMALQGLGGALSDINLVPNERAEKRLQVQRTRWRQLVGIGVAAGVIGALFLLHSALDAQEKRRHDTIAANTLMEDAQKQEKPVQRAHDRVAVLDRVLTKALDRDHPSVDVLVAINRSMPKSTDIWLAQLNFDRGGLMTLRGDSKNSRAVTDLLINLQATGAFTDVRLSYLADAQDSANPNDVVLAAPPKPPVTPLPGLQPAVTTPIPGATPGTTPGPAPGSPGGAAQFGGGRNGFNPAGGSFNPGGGLRGGFNRGGFGGSGAANPSGSGPGGAPGAGAYNPGGGNTQGAIGAAQVTSPGVAPGQLPGSPAPANPVFPAASPTVVPAPSGVGTVPAAGRRLVITPDMGTASAGQPGFNPGSGNTWRQLRNRVTGGGVPSSVNMSANTSGLPMPPVIGVTAPASGAPRTTTSARKAAAATKTDKPTLTGFVITCRLRLNAKLIPPNVRDTAQNSTTPARRGSATPATVIHGATDTSDDTVDLE